ncbi:pyruvate kinase alpha/beta domain-containing protein [Streptomyces sp. M19]
MTWGIETFLGPTVSSTDEMVAQVDEELLRTGRCQKGDLVVITAGSPPGVAGSTNMVRVHHIGEDDAPK